MELTTLRAFASERARLLEKKANMPPSSGLGVRPSMNMAKVPSPSSPASSMGQGAGAPAPKLASMAMTAQLRVGKAVAKAAPVGAMTAAGSTRMMRGPAGAAGGGLKPTPFTPPPGGMPARPMTMPGGDTLKPTAFTPPNRESQFAAASRAAPIGQGAATPAAGFHHDPFGGQEFKVRSPRPNATPAMTGKFASAGAHLAELAGLGILAKPSIDEMRGKHVDEKKKARMEVAGLGVLAAPSAASLGSSVYNRFRKAAPAAMTRL